MHGAIGITDGQLNISWSRNKDWKPNTVEMLVR